MLNEISALIREGKSEEALAKIEHLKTITRGHEKLGDPDAVVIHYPTSAPEAVIESIRPYVLAFFGGDHSAGNVRTCAHLCDSDAIRIMPDWFLKRTGWLGKDDFIYLIYQTLVEMDLIGENIANYPFPYPSDESVEREKLLFAGVIKSVTDPIPAKA